MATRPITDRSAGRSRPRSISFAHTQSIVEAGLANGFDAVVLVNGHGGNRALVGAVVSEVGYANPDSQVLGFTYFDLATDLVEEIRDSDLGGMAHGGERESLVFHLDPSLVDRDAMDAEPFDEPYDLGDEDLVQPGPLGVYRPFEVLRIGCDRCPERASAEKARCSSSISRTRSPTSSKRSTSRIGNRLPRAISLPTDSGDEQSLDKAEIPGIDHRVDRLGDAVVDPIVRIEQHRRPATSNASSVCESPT